MNSASSPYLAFISLARFDKQIYDMLLVCKQLTHEVDLCIQDLQHAEEHVKNSQQKVHDLRKSIDEKELELRILKEREKEVKRKLDVVAAVKEYNSLQHELEELVKTQDPLENTVLELLQEIDEANILLVQAVEAAKKAEKAIGLLIDDKKARRDAALASVENLKKEREKISHLVMPEVLEQYEGMKEKVPNPAVPVMENACSACGYYITAPDLAALRRHKMVMCKDCYRFLYENV